ncbi:glycosyltransferase [Ignatzschineria sp. RMDPL8A]|uniref:glycosyltransferase n=1 Tax=Ignatzschineria sp. RMDPL8A TaxID=2999236 RepID=UPI0024467A75|nr:glycosyltransferase [Ignatzschineria sp. RMDPL8A]MDG9729831.1 glycosyltransferase [Ignatzschineria sp. RMDPL8A]
MISVIMGIHRIDEYVDNAINSILNQTFANFEFIIVANGSDAFNVAKYIQSHFNDPRIKVLTSSIGQLAHALNIGLDASQYNYIARMDADDIAHPERLKKQLKYLLENSLDLVGSNLNLINETNEKIGDRKYPVQHKINRLLPFKNTFAHNTTLYKKKTVINARGYNSGFNTEDYDLWLRLKRKGIKWDNIQEPLLDYRIHTNASQRRLLGYAECAGYAMREFLLKKSFTNFIAIFIQCFKALIRPDRSKKD